jgi:membrane peptidoglycan carboxypeptidase
MLDAALEQILRQPRRSVFHRRRHARVPQLPQGRQRPHADPRDALRESINLPFIRLMRDLVRYVTYQQPNNRVLKDDATRVARNTWPASPTAKAQLPAAFWKKYQRKTRSSASTPSSTACAPPRIRMAAVHRYLFPEPARKLQRLRARPPQGAKITEKLTDERLINVRSLRPGQYDLPDQGFIAKVHPLDLWMMGYLLKNPAPPSRISSRPAVRTPGGLQLAVQEPHKGARDSRIRTMLEIEAFLDIHQRWQRVGYPFDHLVPSLATAIGSSGDRPAALAELIGIILNDGVRMPTLRIDSLHFAAGTPYETKLINDPVGASGFCRRSRRQAPCRRWWMPVPRGGFPAVSNCRTARRW